MLLLHAVRDGVWLEDGAVSFSCSLDTVTADPAACKVNLGLTQFIAHLIRDKILFDLRISVDR